METEEQALFLEGIGCGMLQGYYFTKPIPLETVIERFQSGNYLQREERGEADYWDAISTFSLSDPFSTFGTENILSAPPTEYPVCIMERRDGHWRLIRENRSHIEFFGNSEFSAPGHSPLQVSNVDGGFDDEFDRAVERSNASGSWEAVGGRAEDGTGLHFYVRPVAQTRSATAYMSVGVPTMLGRALGSYGDVPVAYAVFRVVLDDARTKATDAKYVYANPLYCEWLDVKLGNVIGRSFKEVNENASATRSKPVVTRRI